MRGQSDPSETSVSQPKLFDPFAESCDARSYIPRRSAEQALRSLGSQVTERAPVVLLRGPAGIGKSILLRVLVERMGEERQALYASFPAPPGSKPCSWILEMLGRPASGSADQGLMEAARAAAAEGKQGLLLVLDHATQAPLDAVLELTRVAEAVAPHLSVIFAVTDDDRAERLVHVVSARTRAPCVRLDEPMDETETRSYVHVKLAWAKVPREIRARFDASTLRWVREGTGGLPRAVNHRAWEWLQRFQQGIDETLRAEAKPRQAARIGPEAIDLQRDVELLEEIPPVDPQKRDQPLDAGPVAEQPAADVGLPGRSLGGQLLRRRQPSPQAGDAASSPVRDERDGADLGLREPRTDPGLAAEPVELEAPASGLAVDDGRLDLGRSAASGSDAAEAGVPQRQVPIAGALHGVRRLWPRALFVLTGVVAAVGGFYGVGRLRSPDGELPAARSQSVPVARREPVPPAVAPDRAAESAADAAMPVVPISPSVEVVREGMATSRSDTSPSPTTLDREDSASAAATPMAAFGQVRESTRAAVEKPATIAATASQPPPAAPSLPRSEPASPSARKTRVPESSRVAEPAKQPAAPLARNAASGASRAPVVSERARTAPTAIVVPSVAEAGSNAKPTAYVRLRVEVATGMLVKVDGTVLGVAPLPDLLIEPGPHSFVAEAPDGSTTEQLIDVRPETLSVEFF